MTKITTKLAIIGAAFALAACDPVPTAQAPAAPNSAAAQMNQIFEKYTPLSFKAMRISEMRSRLKAGGYVRTESRRTPKGETNEVWRSTISRGGKAVSRTRVRFTTCPSSTIVAHSRTTLDDMHASFMKEVLTYIRARPAAVKQDKRETFGGKKLRFLLIGAEGPRGRYNAPRGTLKNTLGGVRIFNSGERRVGITIHTSCGK